MDKILSFIGLMRRSGHLFMGMDMSMELCKKQRAKLLVLASDAGKSTVRKAQNVSGTVPALTLPYGKAEVGKALGKEGCAIFALDDLGLAQALKEKLASLSGASPKDAGSAPPKEDSQASSDDSGFTALQERGNQYAN